MPNLNRGSKTYQNLKDAFGIESEISARVTSTEDAREGPRAFMEKREPVFTGR